MDLQLDSRKKGNQLNIGLIPHSVNRIIENFRNFGWIKAKVQGNKSVVSAYKIAFESGLSKPLKRDDFYNKQTHLKKLLCKFLNFAYRYIFRTPCIDSYTTFL